MIIKTRKKRSIFSKPKDVKTFNLDLTTTYVDDEIFYDEDAGLDNPYTKHKLISISMN